MCCSAATPRRPSVRQLLRRGYIKGIIGLPANLFYGTGIPACIVVLDKENAQARTGVFMIDASKGFMKDGNKNRLRSQDIHKIVDVFNKQTEIERYSRMVPLHEIAEPKNDYNLNIPRYIDSSEPEDIQDLHAHLHGGIPDRDLDALNALLGGVPISFVATLFKPNRPGYSDLAVDVADVQQTILDADEFQKFADGRRGQVARLVRRASASPGSRSPRTLCPRTSSPDQRRSAGPVQATPARRVRRLRAAHDLLARDVMHDDVFLVMNDGWVDAAKPRKTIEDKERKLSETPDLVIGSGRSASKFKTDLIPPALSSLGTSRRNRPSRRTERGGRRGKPRRRGVHRGARRRGRPACRGYG